MAGIERIKKKIIIKITWNINWIDMAVSENNERIEKMYTLLYFIMILASAYFIIFLLNNS